MFTSLLNLVLLASKNMKFAYKQYHRMFADIVNRMRNNDIRKKDIDPMFWRARQWLNLSEGLFPMSEMTIMKHFQPDSIKHIPNQGPLSGWHTLNGETLNSKAKRRVKSNGGRKIENSAYDSLFELEKLKMEGVYSDLKEMMTSPDKSNKTNYYKDLLYDSEKQMFVIDRIKNELIQRSKKANFNKLNEFEFDKIIDFIKGKIIEKYENEKGAIVNSSFYRVFLFLNKCKTDDETLLFSTIKMYNQLILQSDKSEKNVFKECYNSIDLIKFYQGKDPIIIEFDLLTLKEIYFYLIERFECMKSAITMGIKNHGRGFSYSQKENSLEKFNIKFSEEPFNNYLNGNWYKKNHYNSWCKVNCKNSICYGQLNYFFSVKITNDYFVSSMHIASVTCRETQLPDFSINYDELSGNQLYDQKLPLPHILLRKVIGTVSEAITSYKADLPLFICFESILRTKVASIGFIKRGTDDFIPILVKTEKKLLPYLFAYEDAIEKKNENPYIVHLNNESKFPIEMIGFIDLSPENLVEKEKKKIFDEIEWIDDVEWKLEV